MKKLFLLIISFLSFSFANAEELSCSYKSDFDQCMEENKNWSPHSIEDFICISSEPKNVLYNIVLDKKFKELDKQADDYLVSLYESKNYYFWEQRKEPYVKWTDEIQKVLWINWAFYKKYYDLCNWWEKKSILWEALTCYKEWIPIYDVKSYFTDSNSCLALVKKKLYVRTQVAYRILETNKIEVRKDESKKYLQEQRDKYSKVVDLMMYNIWYVVRISHKWASKTKNPY